MTWPNKNAPGVPENADASGWHYIFISCGSEYEIMMWSANKKEWLWQDDICNVETLSKYRYGGPVAPPGGSEREDDEREDMIAHLAESVKVERLTRVAIGKALGCISDEQSILSAIATLKQLDIDWQNTVSGLDKIIGDFMLKTGARSPSPAMIDFALATRDQTIRAQVLEEVLLKIQARLLNTWTLTPDPRSAEKVKILDILHSELDDLYEEIQALATQSAPEKREQVGNLIFEGGGEIKSMEDRSGSWTTSTPKGDVCNGCGDDPAKTAQCTECLRVDNSDSWLPHDGGPCPVDGETWVRVKLGRQTITEQPAGNIWWSDDADPPVVAYQRIPAPATEGKMADQHIEECLRDVEVHMLGPLIITGDQEISRKLLTKYANDLIASVERLRAAWNRRASGWRPIGRMDIEARNSGQQFDLLSPDNVRSPDCRWDTQKKCWVNTWLNEAVFHAPTHFMPPPAGPEVG